jgi:hypothetical protein
VGWNTGCDRIINNSSSTFTVIDLEDQSIQPLIVSPVGTPAGFATGARRCYFGTVFPWCANSADIGRKAFLFIRDGSLVSAFFMFQRDNTIAFTSFPLPPSPPAFPGIPLISAQARVDVIIDSTGTPSAVTSPGPCE